MSVKRIRLDGDFSQRRSEFARVLAELRRQDRRVRQPVPGAFEGQRQRQAGFEVVRQFGRLTTDAVIAVASERSRR